MCGSDLNIELKLEFSLVSVLKNICNVENEQYSIFTNILCGFVQFYGPEVFDPLRDKGQEIFMLICDKVLLMLLIIIFK